MALPSNVSYGTVTGVFLQAVADTPADPDRAPDGLPVTDLSVTFTASISPSVVRDLSSTPPVMIVVQPVTATVDSSGILRGADGAAGVTLLATSNTALDPHGWVWKVSLSSATFPQVSFSFSLDGGQTIDLATVLQVPADPSVTLAAWLQAVIDAQAARDAAQAAAASVPSAASLAATYLPLTTALLDWAYSQSYRLVSATRDANEAITTGAVVWPDGATGTFTTDTASSAFPGAIDAYHVTHVLNGTTLTVTQTAVTRDAGGAVVNQPALTVA